MPSHRSSTGGAMLKNRHPGRRAFVIGSGPSLNAMDLSWLKDEITIGSNMVFLATRKAGFVSTYHVCTDPTVMKKVHEDYRQMDTQIVAWVTAVERVEYDAANLAKTVEFAEPFEDQEGYGHDLCRPLEVGGGRSVITALALPLALYMGCNPIYVIGCDCEQTGHAYVDPRQNAGHTDAHYKDGIIPAFRAAREHADEVGVAIFNAGVGGKLEVLPRCDFETLRPRPQKETVHVPAESKVLELAGPRMGEFRGYFRNYYRYLYNLLSAAGVKVVEDGDRIHGRHSFYIQVNDRDILIDFSDLLRVPPRKNACIPCFKFHYSLGVHDKIQCLYPFPPTSFYDWKQYFTLSEKITYKAQGEFIVAWQRKANNRRRKVAHILAKTYPGKVITEKVKQIAFWRQVNDCLVAVCVPGQRPGILDRGHFQLMAFGCCTISTRILTRLPYGRRLDPGVHYLKCKDDWSDLVEKVEWCKANREKCRKIGENAKRLFLETSTPDKVWTWIRSVLNAR